MTPALDASEKGSRGRTPDLPQPQYPARPHPGCELCQLPHTAALLYELWAAGRHPSPKQQDVESREILDRLAPDLALEAVKKHFHWHRAPQPFGGKKFRNRDLDETRAWLEFGSQQRRRQILEFVARVQTVSPETVGRVFWADAASDNWDYPTLLARRTLTAMARRQLLYRQWVDSPRAGKPSAVYQLGRVGQKLLSYYHEVEFIGSRSPVDISQMMIPHDLGVGAIYCALAETAGEHEVLGRRVRAQLMQENLWVAKTSVGCQLPVTVDALGRISGHKPKDVRPDGFLVVGIRPVVAEPGKPESFALPVLLERDTGKIKDSHRIASQIAAYFGVATSGAMQARFPDLAAAGENYAVPLLFVTGDYDLPGVKRILNVKRAALKRFEELGYGELPVFLTRFQDVIEHGLLAPTLPMFDPNEDVGSAPNILTTLIRANAALTKARALTDDQVLRIDPAGAPELRRGAGGFGAGSETTKERAAAEVEYADRLRRAEEFSELYGREVEGVR